MVSKPFQNLLFLFCYEFDFQPSMTMEKEKNNLKSAEVSNAPNVRQLRMVGKDEEEEIVDETTFFVIDERRSTSSSKLIWRKKKTVYERENKEARTETFEDTFTIPLHKFNLNLILSQTKIKKIDETVIIQKLIEKRSQTGERIETEQIFLPIDFVNLESTLPMIDYREISAYSVREIRKQLVKKVS